MTDLIESEPWNNIPPALLERIELTIQPLVVVLGPATATGRLIGRRLFPKVKFGGGLTRQAKLFWGRAALQCWQNQYILLFIAMSYAALAETAPDSTNLDPSGPFPLKWMRHYQEWRNHVTNTMIKLDRYTSNSVLNEKKE